MDKVSVDLDAPSPYIESGSRLHRLKRRLTYALPLRFIRQHFSHKAPLAVLEVGTGSGFFLLSAHDAFPNATLTGFEYDERLLETTRKRAPFAECLQGNAEKLDLGQRKFDVIVSFQVIEHLYDPSAMLSRMHRHLKPNGLLIITTPNLDGLGARVMGKRWHGYREDHVSLKGVREWSHLIQSHGFSKKYVGSTFFSGVPLLNILPLGLLNWTLLVLLGSARWQLGESFVGVFTSSSEIN